MRSGRLHYENMGDVLFNADEARGDSVWRLNRFSLICDYTSSMTRGEDVLTNKSDGPGKSAKIRVQDCDGQRHVP